MLFQTILFPICQAGKGLYVMDGAEKEILGRQFKQEGTESLEQGSIARYVRIPVTRVFYGIRRIRHGSRQLAAFPAKTAPLAGRNSLKGIPVQVYTGNPAVTKIPVNIFANPEKHPAQEGQVLSCPCRPGLPMG
jgi:hypothetical protein